MISDFHMLQPYSLTKTDKEILLRKELVDITDFHYNHCPEYHLILDALGYQKEKIKQITDIPFIPVRLFKELQLKSIPDNEVFKTITSSGTTGQMVSRIYLDKETALLQQKVLVRILSDFIGKKRLPMLVIDSPEIIKDRKLFTARGAAIIALNVIATKYTYALNNDMTLNKKVVEEFLEENQGKNFLIFGFTFLLWQHFYKELLKTDKHYDMSKAYIIQSGGWKKFEAEKISRLDFKKAFGDLCGITHFLDHYGMAEQTGCIYAECECGHLHASIYSDFIPRRPEDFSPCEIGEKGIVQVVSSLARSYPGHSILTEDEGVILGEDDCPCGRKGKYIQVLGRIKQAELRGCSDTYAAKF